MDSARLAGPQKAKGGQEHVGMYQRLASTVCQCLGFGLVMLICMAERHTAKRFEQWEAFLASLVPPGQRDPARMVGV